MRNHIRCNWVEVRDRDVVAVSIDGLLIVKIYNHKPDKKDENEIPKKKREWTIERVSIRYIIGDS